MADTYRYKNRRIVNTWYKLGALAIEYIDDLRYGRTPEQSVKGFHFKTLFELLAVYENAGSCELSPFNMTFEGRPMSHELNVMTIGNSLTSEASNCPCESNCLTTEQINIIEEKIVEITHQYII